MGMADVPRAGRDADFEGVYREEVIRLTRVAYLVCGDRRTAEDAVSAVVARVLPRWRAGRVRDPAGYLRRSVVNEVMSLFRRGSREHRANEHLVEVTRPVPDMASGVVERDALLVALADLPVEQRAVLALRYFEDLTEVQTAEVLQISVGTVKSRTARAFEHLRVSLAEERKDA